MYTRKIWNNFWFLAHKSDFALVIINSVVCICDATLFIIINNKWIQVSIEKFAN
jgi:hypothetical protein